MTTLSLTPLTPSWQDPTPLASLAPVWRDRARLAPGWTGLTSPASRTLTSTMPVVCGTPMPLPGRAAVDCISGLPVPGARRSGCDVLLPLLAALLGRRGGQPSPRGTFRRFGPALRATLLRTVAVRRTVAATRVVAVFGVAPASDVLPAPGTVAASRTVVAGPEAVLGRGTSMRALPEWLWRGFTSAGPAS